MLDTAARNVRYAVRTRPSTIVITEASGKIVKRVEGFDAGVGPLIDQLAN